MFLVNISKVNFSWMALHSADLKIAVDYLHKMAK